MVTLARVLPATIRVAQRSEIGLLLVGQTSRMSMINTLPCGEQKRDIMSFS